MARKKAEEAPASRTTTPGAAERTGIAAAQRQMQSTGSRWPRLKIFANERARFHCLTTGSDAMFSGSKYHREGEGMNTRYYLCLRIYTNGEEACFYCDHGQKDIGSRFALWAYVHNVLRASDNPDPEGDAWKPTEVEVEGMERKLMLFREEVKRPMLIRMAAGREQAWFGQFVAMWGKYGSDLSTCIYELRRTGSELATEYELVDLKEEPLAKAVWESPDVKDLPTIEDTEREQLSYGPGAAGAPGGAPMGSDEVLGTEPSADVTGEPEDEAPVAAEEPAEPEDPDSDLI